MRRFRNQDEVVVAQYADASMRYGAWCAGADACRAGKPRAVPQCWDAYDYAFLNGWDDVINGYA